MRVQLLGDLAVWDDNGKPLPVVGPTRRWLLAILLLHAGEVLTADRLIDELWGERAPVTAAKSLQVHVWRLRKALGANGSGGGPLATQGGGYVLRVAPGQLDVEVFERLLGEGRAALSDGQAQAASIALTQALALWHGPALGEFGDQPFARDASSRLEELHLEAIEARIDADLLLGRHRALIAELESLVSANPLRERLRAQLMLALTAAAARPKRSRSTAKRATCSMRNWVCSPEQNWLGSSEPCSPTTQTSTLPTSLPMSFERQSSDATRNGSQPSNRPRGPHPGPAVERAAAAF